MEVKKAKKVIARPAQVNSNQQPSANTGVRTAVVVTRPTFIGELKMYKDYISLCSHSRKLER